MNCIQSQELVQINGKNYISIYLKEKFVPFTKVNEVETRVNPILLEEPNKSDYSKIAKLSIILNKFCAFTETQQLKILENVKDKDLLQELIQHAQQEEQKTEEAELKIRAKNIIDKKIASDVLLSIYALSDQYEGENEHFYDLHDKFVGFINEKIGFELNNLFIPQGMLNIENYEQFFHGCDWSDFFEITRALVASYISFFLGFFRSEKLRQVILSRH